MSASHLFRRGFLILAVGAAACRSEPRTPVQQLVYDLEAAVEARDADRVAALLTPDFRAQGGLTKAAIPAELRRYFFAYQTLDVTIDEVETDGEPPAKVSMRVLLSGKSKDVGGLAGLLPEASLYRFELALRLENGTPRVAEAAWESLEPTPAD